MSEIDELQGRITKALDRIGQGLAAMPSQGGADAEEMAALRQQLEDEKLAGEQLQERLKSVREKHQAQGDAAQAAQKDQAEATQALDAQLQSLRLANQQLRDNNQALRKANAAGLSEPDLINAGQQAELEALRAAQEADRAETNAVLADLGQLISNSDVSQAEDA